MAAGKRECAPALMRGTLDFDESKSRPVGISLRFSEIILHPAGDQFARAHMQAYRYLDHGPAKTRCNEALKPERNFPPGILRFAEAFCDLQQLRNDSDYNPAMALSDSIALNSIADAERAIAAFEAETPESQRAFVVFIALKPRGK